MLTAGRETLPRTPHHQNILHSSSTAHTTQYNIISLTSNTLPQAGTYMSYKPSLEQIDSR